MEDAERITGSVLIQTNKAQTALRLSAPFFIMSVTGIEKYYGLEMA